MAFIGLRVGSLGDDHQRNKRTLNILKEDWRKIYGLVKTGKVGR